MARYELKDERWALIEPVLPQPRGTRGGAWVDHRTVVNGILWVMFSRTASRDMPDRYGAWQAAYDRFGRCRKDGT